MLKRLSVANFAVIERLDLELGAGLTVFTGETGAGKSILIEALGFALGARASTSLLRAGAERLSATAVFDELEARRELEAGGRARAWLSGKPAAVSALSAAGDRLVDFHGQHEHQALLKPAVQLDCLDRFGGLEKETAAVASLYDAWNALKAEKQASELSEEERRRRLDLARYQLEEIDSAAPREGEEEELEQSLPRLKNSEKLRELASSAYEVLYEAEDSASSLLAKADKLMGELARLDGSLSADAEQLSTARVAVDEAARALGLYREGVEADPAALEKTLARQDQLSKLKRKYGPALADVLIHREKLAKEVDALENADSRLEALEGKLAAAEKDLEAACHKLHKGRVKAAKKLESSLLAELKPLAMPEARFEVAVEREEERYSRSGFDAVEFLIAPNPGEPLRPVRAIASGGELSRVMLALKTVLAQADSVPVLVFDEVDAGIGGAAARTVGEKLAALSRRRQVLCVTHLPQVACFAQAHYQVSKTVAAGRTRVSVERLTGERRLESLARMLGGREATAASRKHAKELLESSLA